MPYFSPRMGVKPYPSPASSRFTVSFETSEYENGTKVFRDCEIAFDPAAVIFLIGSPMTLREGRTLEDRPGMRSIRASVSDRTSLDVSSPRAVVTFLRPEGTKDATDLRA